MPRQLRLFTFSAISLKNVIGLRTLDLIKGRVVFKPFPCGAVPTVDLDPGVLSIMSAGSKLSLGRHECPLGLWYDVVTFESSER